MTGRKNITNRPSHSPSLDPCTLSNYHQFDVKLTDLSISVSFEKKIVFGTVSYHLSGSASHLVLDTSYLSIEDVFVDGEAVSFALNDRCIYGSALTIDLPQKSGDFTVSILFSTTEKCTALQFIKGDTDNYLFSQCQSIHARSLFPCFDTPAVKSSYNFTIKSSLPVLMSGLPGDHADGVYYFKQPIPIPSYLVAIASGNIVKAPIGPRSDVYSEQPNIKQCQWEFEADMEDFLQVAEKLTFKYEWSKFDVLVLPLSFPYGGMENPNITFATPTLICKDRSQVKVLAHELAHSWAGNLVTNCSWEHFWLNEGWTVYLERRILGEVAALTAKKLGNPDYNAYGEKYRHFSAILGWSGLVESMSDIKPEATKLVWDLSNNGDPDEFYSRIPYDKGFTFLYYLEQLLGGKEAFDEFIPYYFKKFRYKSIDSYQFIDCLYEFFEPKGKAELLDSVDFNHWLYGEGLPEYQNFDTSLVDECTQLSDKWVKAVEETSIGQFSSKDITNFDANQHLLFLEDLSKKLEQVKVEPTVIASFMDTYPYYAESSNFEVINDFYSLVIKYGQFKETDEPVTKFANWLGTVGRMKYVRPGYRLLAKFVSRDFAINTFNRFDSYHPICRNLVKKDLGI